MQTEIISVAHFAGNEEIKKTVLTSDAVRAETLRRCYLIDGYTDFPLDKKNETYDRIKDEVMTEWKISW